MNQKREYPCDITDSCPFDGKNGMDCYNQCGLGADEDSQENQE